MINVETNQREYVYVMIFVFFLVTMDDLYHREGLLCDEETVTSPAQFKTRSPEILIVDVTNDEKKPNSRHTRNGPRMTDLKRIVIAGNVRCV